MAENNSRPRLRPCKVAPPPASAPPAGAEPVLTFPYPNNLICCTFTDRPFQLRTKEQCVTEAGEMLEWPSWEKQYGCSPPPSSPRPSTPTCCFQINTSEGDEYLKNVAMLPLKECMSSTTYQSIPISWCDAPRCLTSDTQEDYPEGMKDPRTGQRWPSRPDNSLPRDSNQLFMFTGMAVLLMVLFTCCFFSMVILMRTLFGAQRHRSLRAPVPEMRTDVSFTTLDTFQQLAEMMPDDAERTRALDVSGDDLEGSQREVVWHEDGSAVVVVLMPDKSTQLGQVQQLPSSAPNSVSAAVKATEEGAQAHQSDRVPHAGTGDVDRGEDAVFVDTISERTEAVYHRIEDDREPGDLAERATQVGGGDPHSAASGSRPADGAASEQQAQGHDSSGGMESAHGETSAQFVAVATNVDGDLTSASVLASSEGQHDDSVQGHLVVESGAASARGGSAVSQLS